MRRGRLIARLTREDVDLYLETRRQQGFNTVMVELIDHQFTDNPPNNAYSVRPFTRAGDFSTPNEAYFAHAEYVIAKANEKGMLVLLDAGLPGIPGRRRGLVRGNDRQWRDEAARVRPVRSPTASAPTTTSSGCEGGDYDAPDKTLSPRGGQWHS